ncbi:hypothetical protein E3Q24_02111 [Wallemia mellicola]|nr:hypothetical protein E3Q24_02111 [Wallemia mellicola]
MAHKASNLYPDIIYTIVDILIINHHESNVGYMLSLNRHWRGSLLVYPKAFSSFTFRLRNTKWPPIFPGHFYRNLRHSNNRISNLNLESDYFIFCKLLSIFHDSSISWLTLVTNTQPTLGPEYRNFETSSHNVNIGHLKLVSKDGHRLCIPTDIVSHVAGVSLTLESVIPIPSITANFWKIKHLTLDFRQFSNLDAHHLRYFLGIEVPKMQALKTLYIAGANIGLMLGPRDYDHDENNFMFPLLHTIHLDNTSPFLLQYFKSPVLRRVSIKNYDLELHRPTLCADVIYFSLEGSLIILRYPDTIHSSFFAKLNKLEILDLSRVPPTTFTDAFNSGMFDLFWPRLRALKISFKKDITDVALLHFVQTRRDTSEISSINELVAIECGLTIQIQCILTNLIPKCHLDIGRFGHNANEELSF